VVTSDHGYIFFGASLEATRASDAPELIGQARMKQFAPEEAMPTWNPDLQVIAHTRTAMLRGRLRARPQGTSSRKLYQHGGFSLMEVLVPWIELEASASGLRRLLASEPFKITGQQFRETMEADFYDQ